MVVMRACKTGNTLGFIAAALMLLTCAVHAAPPDHAARAGASLDFVASPYADFLFYLLHRDNANFPDLRASVPIDDVKELNTGELLPAYAMVSDIRSYADLYKLAYTYDNSAALVAALKQGEAHFPTFLAYWQQHVEPREQQTITVWKAEEVKARHVERLEELTRLRFPYATVKVAVIALGPLGGNMQNPPIMFATMKDSSLPAVIGYDGTHMMLSGHADDWKQRKHAAQAINLIYAHGGTSYDIEEALCLLMQSKLPQAYGAGSDHSPSDVGDTARRMLLRAMEHDWDRYRSDASMNAMDFAIDETIRTFSASGVATLP
jgi:hypothetical protein